jgi:hypothetical protein
MVVGLEGWKRANPRPYPSPPYDTHHNNTTNNASTTLIRAICEKVEVEDSIHSRQSYTCLENPNERPVPRSSMSTAKVDVTQQ